MNCKNFLKVIMAFSFLFTTSQLSHATTTSEPTFEFTTLNSPNDTTIEKIKRLTTLDSEQISLLNGRHFLKDGFSIRVLTGTVNGKQRSVVLMGETHFKTKNTQKKADAIVNEFDLFGTEGVELKQYWGNAKALDYLLELVNKALGPLLQGSTVDSAYDKAATADNTRSAPTVYREVISLEKNFQPNIQDNLAVLLVPFTFAMTIFGKCLKLSCQTWPSFLMLRNLKNIPIAALKVVMAYLAIDILSRLMFSEDKWQDNVFIFSTGLLYHRNEFMTENIVKTFQDRTDQQNMLVITGFMHQSGILNLLVNQYGFREIELD